MKGKKLLKVLIVQRVIMIKKKKKERVKEQLRILENLQKENPDLNNSIITLWRKT